MDNNQKIKIGIFDSGLGGLTVFKSLSTAFSSDQISFIYVGDLAHLPYGDKSQASIIKYSKKIINFFLDKQVDLIIVACNSASSVALKSLQKFFPHIPIVGTIEPTIQQVSQEFINRKSATIGIIGTDTTINSHSYNEALNNFDSITKFKIFALSCPLFVPLVEEGWEKTDIAYQIAIKYLEKFNHIKLDAMILACTHYPMLIDILKSALNNYNYKNLIFIESGSSIVNFLLRNSESILNTVLFDHSQNSSNNHLIGMLDEFYVTDTPHHFHNLANKFLGEEINNIQLISL